MKKLKIPPPPSAEPDTIAGGRFKITGKIGEGAAGTVYEAVQLSVDRRVAIKVLQKVHDAMPDFKERFTREARAIARLNHANCITLYDFGYSDEFDSLFMVTEFVEGKDLYRVLRDGRPTFREAVRLGTQIAEGLAHAHDNQILHRDLKPENILVATNGDLKILDFGLVRILDRIQSEHGRRLTAQGMVYGTPHYMSPEQCEGDLDVSPQTDLYSFGIILFELIEGRLPFDSKEILKILVQQIEAPIPPITADVPVALKALIESMMAKSAADRPESAHAVAEALHNILLGDALTTGELTADISQEISRSLLKRRAVEAHPDESTSQSGDGAAGQDLVDPTAKTVAGYSPANDPAARPEGAPAPAARPRRASEPAPGGSTVSGGQPALGDGAADSIILPPRSMTLPLALAVTAILLVIFVVWESAGGDSSPPEPEVTNEVDSKQPPAATAQPEHVLVPAEMAPEPQQAEVVPPPDAAQRPGPTDANAPTVEPPEEPAPAVKVPRNPIKTTETNPVKAAEPDPKPAEGESGPPEEVPEPANEQLPTLEFKL